MRLLLALALVFAASWARATPSVFLEEHTWLELRAAIEGGRTTVLIPVGGTEQNGPHIALGKHNARVKELSRRIAERLGNALVAPVVAYVPEGAIDPPTGHMRFPGTITIAPETFEKTLESAARSLLRHGFKHVVLLGDHGGYRTSLDRVASRVRGVHALPQYYREMDHAGADDTSLTLAIDPALVRPERLAAMQPGESGAKGDPRGARRARGVELAQEIVDRAVAAIGKIAPGR